MAADTSVKVFKSTDAGAPSLSGAAGALIAVLDACLVNGYNLLTAQSVSIASGVAMLTFASAHGFVLGGVLLVAGATPAGLNGERRVLSATTNSLTIDATGIPDGAASGTITAKMAPAGWSKPFSGANLAAYKPTDAAARTQYIRIDDTGTTEARACGYEEMMDINTGTGKIPTEAQVSGGLYWPKANTTSGTRPWMVIADGKTIYVWVACHASYATGGYVIWFGDLGALRSSDTYAWGISGAESTVVLTVFPVGSMGWRTGSSVANDPGLYLARAASGLGGARGAARLFSMFPAVSSYVNIIFGSSDSILAYPNPSDNSLILSPMLCCNTSTLRGVFRGLYATPQAVGTAIGNGSEVVMTGALAGKAMMSMAVGNIGAAPSGAIFADVTGPWG